MRRSGERGWTGSLVSVQATIFEATLVSIPVSEDAVAAAGFARTSGSLVRERLDVCSYNVACFSSLDGSGGSRQRLISIGLVQPDGVALKRIFSFTEAAADFIDATAAGAKSAQLIA